MGKREEPDDLDTLRRCWQQWTAVVELFAARRGARRRVDPQAYSALHRRLLDACRSLAGPGEGELANFYRELEALAQPWLSPEVLERADGRLLADLRDRCRKKVQGLGGFRRGVWFRASTARLPGGRVRVGRVFLALAAVAGLVVFLFWKAGRLPRRTWYALNDVWDPVWFFLKGTNTTQRLVAGGIALTLLSVYFASRTARS